MIILEKLARGQGDEYMTGCLLNYTYFKENYKLIAIDFNKQKPLDVNLKATQRINFNKNVH